MKRFWIALVASALMASAANAAFHVTVDVDKPWYQSGGVGTIELTLTTDGPHTLGPLAVIEYAASWDPALLRVVGSNPGNAQGGAAEFGTSTQQVFAGLSGSPTPVCFNTADSCVTLSQLSLANTTVDGTVTGQLVLEVVGSVSALNWAAILTIVTENAVGDGATADSITIGPNYFLTPEPTTAALLGLGLVGLGVAARRH